MGRQIRFYNFSADVPAFEQFVVENGATIIQSTAPIANPVAVPTLLRKGDAAADLLVARTGDLSDLHWRHVPARDVWAIDKDSSAVIEYTPGYTRDGEPKFGSSLGHGRMWFQTSCWVDGRLVPADPDFAAWAGRLFNWIKKRWVLIGSDYYSPAAAELWDVTRPGPRRLR